MKFQGRRRQILILLTISSVVFSLNVSIAYPLSDIYQGIKIKEQSVAPFTHASAYDSIAPIDVPFPGVICDQPSDAKCAELDWKAYEALLVPCDEKIKVGCIKSVAAITTTGKIQAKFQKFMNADSVLNLIPNPEKGIVKGVGSGGVWTVNDPAGVTRQVAVQVHVKASNKEIGVANDGDATNFNIWAMQVHLTPIREREGTFLPSHYESVSHPNTSILSAAGGRLSNESNRNCVAAEEDRCYEKTNFENLSNWEVSLSFPNKFTGWFHGRLSNPEVNFISNQDGSVEVTISGKASKVPGIQERKVAGTWGKKLEEYVLSQPNCEKSKVACVPSDGGFIEVGPVARDESAFTLASLLLDSVKDKSTFTDEFWSFGTGFGIADSEISRCINEHPTLSAIVTTNSLIYSSGPPTFNKEGQTLEYRVLSPHFDEKSQENLGTYDLVLDSKVARCIYGFSDAPVSAFIEVTSEEGASKVVATSFRETGSWMHFSASGFTYSNPKIRVRLSQAESISSPVKSNASAKETSPKKTLKSVLCTKSGSIKKVSGVKPTCPKGFKRVRS